ncbi:MAG: hypothetical protein AYK23_01485 [Candidatus Proteinoplasmatales archaeon SG8-5]|nr:MAG: hypothetical protein AYK23_01485 [Candidatus Proteinoplasmatales archaeon SG8-5]
MAKMLDGYRFKSLWTTHIGCIKGAVDYLNLDISLPWIFGGTGHAFVMNIHEELCPSGPTAWRFQMLFELAPNLGYKTDGMAAFRNEKGSVDWVDAPEAAWDFTKKCIDANVPVYGWEMKVPEFYCVHGYDDVGYYYNGCLANDGEGPKPWQELGQTEIGYIEMCGVHPVEPAPPAKAVKEAFEKVLWFAENPEGYVFPKYASGLKAYDYWMKFLDDSVDYQEGHAHGIGYNAEVWSECRKFAVDFLNEAKFKINDHVELFDTAIEHYSEARDAIQCTADLYPFLSRQLSYLQDDERRASAVKDLQRARDAEEQGLEALAELVKVL